MLWILSLCLVNLFFRSIFRLQIITLCRVIVIMFATEAMLYPCFIHVHIFHDVFVKSQDRILMHTHPLWCLRWHANCKQLVEKYLCQIKSQRKPTALWKTVWMNVLIGNRSIRFLQVTFSKIPLLWEVCYRNTSYCYSKIIINGFIPEYIAKTEWFHLILCAHINFFMIYLHSVVELHIVANQYFLKQ